MLRTSEFWNNYESCKIYDIDTLPQEMIENIDKAKAERLKAYAPYSKYAVSAVLVTETGKAITGVNSENCIFDGTCAEAGAVASWTSTINPETMTREEIVYVVVVGKTFESENLPSREDVYVTPCGRCRQRLSEHCLGDTIIVCTNETLTKARVCKLSDLLPFVYTPKNLNDIF